MLMLPPPMVAVSVPRLPPDSRAVNATEKLSLPSGTAHAIDRSLPAIEQPGVLSARNRSSAFTRVRTKVPPAAGSPPKDA